VAESATTGAGADAQAAARTLILNGDIFDFDLVTCAPDDAPFRVGVTERRRCLRATEDRSIWKLDRILADHGIFLGALADFLAAGNRVVYVLGNHDREFYFSGVQQRLLEAVQRAGAVRGHDSAGWRIRFEPWFYYVPGEIYAEHGQQYDHYTAYRHILQPTVRFRRREEIALPMGNLSNRYLMTRMGYFNPHSSDFILNLVRYVAHWLRYYAFSRRSLVFPWFFGSLAVMSRLLRIKEKQLRRPKGYEERMQAMADRYDLAADQLEQLRRLQFRPITYRVFRMLREFWIDRLTLVVAMILGTVVLALVSIPLWIKLMVPLSTFPLIYLLYEQLARGEDIFSVERDIPWRAARIGRLLRVPVITFGHTHVPRLLPLSDRLTFVDTGTWAPMIGWMGNGGLPEGYRNYLRVRVGPGEPQVSIRSWPLPAEERRPDAQRPPEA